MLLTGPHATAGNVTNSTIAPSGINLQQIGWLPSNLFNDANGLPDIRVNAIAVQTDGTTWVGTMRGLARKSGMAMQPEHGPDNSLDDPIVSLATTPGNELLVATEARGTWRLRNGRWDALGSPFPQGRTERLRVLADGPRLRIFALGASMAELVDAQWKPLPIPPLLANHQLMDIAIDAQTDTMWVATYGAGLVRCDRQLQCTNMPLPDTGPRTDEARTLLLQPGSDGRNTLWVGLQGGGLARLQGSQWTRWHTGNSPLPSNFISALHWVTPRTGPGELWAGTRSGLIVQHANGSWKQADPRLQPLHERIHTILATRSHRGIPEVWVGTESGAVRTPLQGEWHLISTLGHDANGIWALRVETTSQGRERLWLGSDGEGIARHEDGQWQRYGRAEGLPNLAIRSIERVPDGSAEGALWVGTWGGHLLELRNDRFVTLNTPWLKQEEESIRILLAERNNVWISTRYQGLAHWDGTRWLLVPASAGAPTRAFAAIRVGQDVWFSTREQGLARLRAGQWRYFSSDIALPAGRLLDVRLFPDASGRQVLWVGTANGGIQRIDVTNPDHPTRIDTPALPPLPVKSAYGAVRDARGDYLVCTDYGVFRWHPEGNGFRSTPFYRRDGLPHDECNSSVMQADTQGRVWIGTIGGAAVYTPPMAPPSTPAPLHLTGVQVNGQRVPLPAGVLKMPAADSPLTLEYELLTGELESANRYRVSLVGVSPHTQDWQSDNIRHYPHLPIGRQRIHIEAIDAWGQSPPPLELVIEVPRAWWQTPVSRAIFVLGGLVLCWCLLRLRLRTLNQRQAQLRSMVHTRTAQLQESEAGLRRANDELRRLSYTDALTGLGNRRELYESLDTLCRACAVGKRSLALLMIDLDHFKSLNDSLGHLGGDACLQEVARVIRRHLPRGAMAMRYGGEEFCVLLQDADLETARLLADRIRQYIAEMHPPCCAGLKPHLTISVGVVAQIPDAGCNADGLLQRADRAMYQAKAEGRNRVVTAAP